MQVFVGDDRSYLDWLARHPEGWVLNVRMQADPDYVVLHRATCPTISRPSVRAGAWTERSYRKVCCTNPEDIAAAARAEGRVDGRPSKVCGICHPQPGR